jgi:hypothetical protein
MAKITVHGGPSNAALDAAMDIDPGLPDSEPVPAGDGPGETGEDPAGTPAPDRPALNALKADWVEYRYTTCIDRTRAELEAMTKAELVDDDTFALGDDQ